MEELRTARLVVVPLTLDLLRAAVRDPAEVGRALGVRVAAGWPNADEADLFPWLAGQIERNPALLDWGQTVFIHTADRTLIGTGGFKGAPDEAGTVEFGYGITPAYRNRGYATEGMAALIDWAFGQPGVRRVFADCLPKNRASARVLAKLGLGQLPRTGDLLDWELTREDWLARRQAD